ncbi:MAG: hypothetical protein J6X65_06610 [Bacteroidales bacterium]|nr:hypothetical protein [Bacteroidales bacterium]
MPHHLSPEPCSLPPPAARHYHSALSIWLSVDPMADKYPSTSPYTYCANNPVRLVDADGREIGIPPFGIGIGIGIGIGTVIDGLIYKQKAKCSTMTISGNLQAVRHYYWGGGHKVKLDSKYTTLLMNTEKFKKMHQKIINGKITTSGYFAIDMTKEKDAFFIGRTGVAFNISTSEDGKINTVAYTLFTYQNQPDGFSDPNFIIENIMPQLADGKGSNLELGGTPYDFIPQKIKIEYPNPKYHEVQ